jgi:hypothetical protein
MKWNILSLRKRIAEKHVIKVKDQGQETRQAAVTKQLLVLKSRDAYCHEI